MWFVNLFLYILVNLFFLFRSAESRRQIKNLRLIVYSFLELKSRVESVENYYIDLKVQLKMSPRLTEEERINIKKERRILRTQLKTFYKNLTCYFQQYCDVMAFFEKKRVKTKVKKIILDCKKVENLKKNELNF